jgi:thiol-disulfide isomerase/thioredoxin
MHPILQYFRPRLSSTTLLLTSCALSIMIALFAVFPTVRTEAKPKIGKLPPEVIANYKIRATDGRTYTLGELRGKVVVLDFFAIWCGHSRHHIPSMTEFGDTEKKQGLQIIGLAVNDAESTPQRVKKFIDEMHIEYPVGMISDPEFARYVDSRDVSVPQTLVYGRDGRLIAHFSGHNNSSEKELADVIGRELEKR